MGDYLGLSGWTQSNHNGFYRREAGESPKSQGRGCADGNRGQ